MHPGPQTKQSGSEASSKFPPVPIRLACCEAASSETFPLDGRTACSLMVHCLPAVSPGLWILWGLLYSRSTCPQLCWAIVDQKGLIAGQICFVPILPVDDYVFFKLQVRRPQILFFLLSFFLLLLHSNSYSSQMLLLRGPTTTDLN